MTGSHLSLKKKRIRTFFSTFGIGHKDKSKIDEIQKELEEKGLTYIQMKLPIEKITPEFEAKLKKSVEQSYLHAKIRKVAEQDLESLMHLYNKAWMTSHTPFSPITIDSLKSIYEYPETIILIANVYGSDAGFIILDFEGSNNEYGIIAGLGVLPRFQRKGLGKILGMAAWDLFKKKGVKELRCEVYIENKSSYNFIKSLGFEEYEKKVYKMEDFHLNDESI
ncbi:MAG: GNAT family N-acetyltransferase [Promethearchaeota archaeon]